MSNRRYPDFFVVGAQRAGTTSLYQYLRQHPAVFMSAQKETHYFSQDRVRIDRDLVIRSESRYLQEFAHARADAIVGEASPSYLWHPDVPKRIHAKQPHAKIVIMLRDPKIRAYSQYLMDLADGMRPEPFERVVVRDYLHGPKMYGVGRLYAELGLYAAQVNRYLETFGPDNVLIVKFLEFGRRPSETVARVLEFLGADTDAFRAGTTATVHNQAVAPRNWLVRYLLPLRSFRQVYRRTMPHTLRRRIRQRAFVPTGQDAMRPEAVEFLNQLFVPDLEALETVLTRFYGRMLFDAGDWKRAATAYRSGISIAASRLARAHRD